MREGGGRVSAGGGQATPLQAHGGSQCGRQLRKAAAKVTRGMAKRRLILRSSRNVLYIIMTHK